MKTIILTLISAIILNFPIDITAQSVKKPPKFRKIKILLRNGEKSRQTSVVVTFLDTTLSVKSKNNVVSKTFKYSDIKSAAYSYSKSPRWKTGLGLGAASLVLPPLLLIAIPLGFTKHRRHWLMIRTEKDYAVLKLSKSTRKLFIPTFETKSGVTVKALGEEK